jgi:excisionase family DNA binding protein
MFYYVQLELSNIRQQSARGNMTGKDKKELNSTRATYKVRDAAKVAGVGECAIRKGVAAGTIPHIRFGRNILIPKTAFLRYLDSCGGTA